MQADIFGIPITTMRVEEGPAFGAALLAGVGAGVYADTGRAVGAVATGETITPDPDAVARYDELYQVYRELYGSLRPAFGMLNQD